jgi:hypothetical protein
MKRLAPEHPAPGVDGRAAEVAVEVDHGEPAGVEVDQQASVVQVRGDPADVGEVAVKVDQLVEEPHN